MKPKERRLAAIMFTDIVGYSAMMQKDEELANRLRERHKQVFHRLHEQYGGEILQYFGDGTLSIFPSATAAAECALALQQTLKREPKVPIRVGIHSGEITYSDEEAYGDGVNIAARLESLCVPGGIFVSGKVYDDIKNHPRLRAKSLGYFQLKNIQQDIDVYAISNEGISVPDYEWERPRAAAKALEIPREGRKRKGVAALLALLFGIFGAHRFYLDQREKGILHLLVFCLTVFVIPRLSWMAGVLAIIGFVDFILLMSMPRATFNARYNASALEKEQARLKAQEAEAADPKRLLRERFHQHWEKARKEYQEYDYESALQFLQKALDIKYDDAEAHFLAACCFSATENAEKALHHLDLAVAFGLKDTSRIHTSDDLSFLRIQPAFEAFARNEYRIPRELPAPESGLPEEEAGQPDLLEQLSQLQKLKAEGKLTEEEFLAREEKLREKR